MFSLDALFCPKGYRFAYDVDDFYRSFEQYCSSIPQLTAIEPRKKMSLSYESE